jgi:PAS domain S-box-containing protein
VPDRGAPTSATRTPSCLAEARLGDHLGHLFATPQERAAAAAELLAAAMARGERALGLGDEASLAALAEAVAARGVDVATALARGALQLVPHREQFLPDGTFDPAQVLRAWQVRTEAALAAGFTGLVVASDMDWALSRSPGVERLLEYEAAQGLAFGRHFAGMCQYDTTRFRAPLLRGVLRSHALLVHAGQVLHNPGAVPTGAGGQPEPADAEVARLLRALHEQGRAENVVQQREERFRRLAGESADLLYRYRLAPEPGFEYVSPSATAMTGYTPEEHYADPRLGLKLVHPDDRERLEEFTLDPSTGPILLRWIRKDGRVVWAELHNTLVRNAAGQPLAIQGIARDVTERMAAEAALREAERLAAIGRLAAGVAHEINNPLAWMGPNVRFVQEALASLDARGGAAGLGELREALAEVVDGVARVRAIVSGLQDPAGSARGAERQPEAVLAGAPAAPAAATPPRGRVLVVDDEPQEARSVARVLGLEHDVTVLTSSAEALRRAEAGERWDVVLCDLMMPELSGPALAERLAEVAPELAGRMVFLTGGAFTAEGQAVVASGQPWLEKPVDPAALRARVRLAVAAARGVAPSR